MINFYQLVKKVVTGFRAITIQSYTEANVKNGVQFYARRAFTGPLVAGVTAGEFAANDKRYIYFRTGAKPVIVKDRVVKFIGEEFALRLYNATGETAPTLAGALTVSNYRSDGLAKPTTVLVNEVFTADIAGLGSMIGDPEYYFGSSSQGQRNADSILEGRERVLPPNAQFYVEVELTAGSSGRFEYFLDWYEGDSDLPRKG